MWCDSYVFSKHYDLLKWKWADLRSVDLIVHIEERDDEREVKLFCEGPDKALINCSVRGERNVGIGKFDTYRLLAEIPAHLLGGGGGAGAGRRVIAEVAYDVAVGMWEYKKVRGDKSDPNFIDSVLGVFIEQAEAISRDELEYVVLASVKGWELDYDEQIGKMRKKLMDWQKSRK